MQDGSVNDDLAARVAAELEIRNVISRIAILADQGDLDEYVDQFTESSVWDLPTAPRYGRAEIRAGAEARRAKGITGPGSASRHVITTVAVRVDGPDTGVADSYFVFLQTTTTAPTILNMGVYHDTFVREGQVWRLARREITLG
jgi:3-phenylpropionate/cinnamic acid dioxygenase small subunit